MKPLYLYAIVKEKPRSLGTGLGRGKLEIVRAGKFFVVAQRGSAPQPTTAALRAHDRIVRRIEDRVSALLPFRFGTTADDARHLASLVAPVAKLVGKNLALVRGCAQYTLRVHGDASPRPAARGGPGTRFLAALVEARRVPEIEPVLEAIAPFVRASRVERHDRPPLLASVYHLVPRSKAGAYREALTRSAAALDVAIRVTGPFPPYAFAELT